LRLRVNVTFRDIHFAERHKRSGASHLEAS
jgi:hypothetical protein